MTKKDAYKRILREQTVMALATGIAAYPTVRLVSFYYDEETQLVYFATNKDSLKASEIVQNPHVAFSTIPLVGTYEHVRSIEGVANKSRRLLSEIKTDFIAKDPTFERRLAKEGALLELYEIDCPKFLVTFDLINNEIVTL